jgi:uncharacterized protein YbaP (TraB family)
MKKTNLFVLQFLLFLSVLFLSHPAFAESSLWKISSEKGTLYLQGSVHLLKPENYPLAPAIEQAYTESEVLVLEVDMKEMTSLSTQQKILKKALLTDGKKLPDLMSKITYQKLSDACAQVNLPVSSLDRFKPWFAAMTLTLTQTKNMGFDPQHGLDTYFFNKATAESKKVMGLESVDFQIDLFASLSQSNPDDFIAHTLVELETLENDLDQLVEAWISGDIETLGTLLAKGFKEYPDLYNTFVVERNKRWMKKLDALLKKSTPCMVVVGAGHLPGKGGLLTLLKEKGYTIEQL